MTDVALKAALIPKRSEATATATGAAPAPSQPSELSIPAAAARLFSGTKSYREANMFASYKPLQYPNPAIAITNIGIDCVQPVTKRNGVPAISASAWTRVLPVGCRRAARSANTPPERTPMTEAICRYAVPLNPAIARLMWNFRLRNDGIQVRNIAATKF